MVAKWLDNGKEKSNADTSLLPLLEPCFSGQRLEFPSHRVLGACMVGLEFYVCTECALLGFRMLLSPGWEKLEDKCDTYHHFSDTLRSLFSPCNPPDSIYFPKSSERSSMYLFSCFKLYPVDTCICLNRNCNLLLLLLIRNKL